MNFLATACAQARARVEQEQRVVPLPALQARARAGRQRSLADVLQAPGVSVIAEVKRASPSRGHLAAIPDPAELARAYARGGAAAVSVLTEPQHFSGSIEDLVEVAAAVDVPVVRKDFVVDAYQVWQAAAAGASAVLLIVAALDQPALSHLTAACAEAGVDPLVEVHTVEEAQRAAELGPVVQPRPLVLGVNARNLSTLAVDPGRFAEIRRTLPSGALAVAESGISGPADVARARALGADAILVGEHLVSALDPEQAVRDLVDAGRAAR